MLVPRFILSTCATGIYLPIAIVVATKFQTALNNFLSCVSYSNLNWLNPINIFNSLVIGLVYMEVY